MNNFLQFQVWKDCNNKCNFCYTGNSKSSVSSKLKRLDFILNEVCSDKYKTVNRVGLIGGEFFDGQLETDELKEKFIEVITTIVNKPEIKDVLITSSLLFLDRSDFIEVFLNIPHHEKLILCTSWDSKYRFHQKWSEFLWEQNLHFIHREFPDIKVHVETILTQDFITRVLDNKFNIKEFENRYFVTLDFCNPVVSNGFKDKYSCSKELTNFFPKRNDFLKFLSKVYREGQASPEKLSNYNNMSTMLWVDIDGTYTFLSGHRGPVDGITVNQEYLLPTMHEKSSDYIDSNVRMRKDILDMWESFYG